MRICFFGDSFVQGTGDPEGLGWVGRLCAGARREGIDITGYNLGIRRETSADIRRRWRGEAEALLPPHEPGGLVFAFGTNDCTPGDDSNVRVARPHAIVHARAILSEACAWHPTLMLGPLPVLDDAATDERVAKLSGELGSVCVALRIPFLDTFSLAARSGIWRASAASGDGTHPDAAGYAALAEMIAQWPPWRELIGAGR